MNKISRIFIQIGILLSFIGTIVVNLLSAFGYINGIDPGTLSDLLPNLFVPWGSTFLVWNVIYIGLLALTIYSIKSWFIKDEEPPEFLDKFGIEFIIAAVANISWIFLWHYQTDADTVYLSLIAMLVLLGSLLSMYIRLRIGKNEEASTAEKWTIHIPISFYLGWITIATVANVTALLVDKGWDTIIAPTDFWAVFWTILVIAVAAIITLLILLLRKDIAYSLIVVWALTGIIIKRVQTAPLALGVVIGAAVSIGLIVIMIGITIFRLVPKKSELST